MMIGVNDVQNYHGKNRFLKRKFLIFEVSAQKAILGSGCCVLSLNSRGNLFLYLYINNSNNKFEKYIFQYFFK